MQSNIYIAFALILSVAGILLGVAIILNAPFARGFLSSAVGLGISLVSLLFAVKGNRVVKTALGNFGFILSVIGIIINTVILIQWIACAAFDFITVDASVGTGIFGTLFQY